VRIGIEKTEEIEDRLVHETRRHHIERFRLERMGSGAQSNCGCQVVVATGIWIVSRPDRRITGDVNLLTLRNQCKPGQWIRVFSADQRADSSSPCITDAQTGPVTGGPRQFFVKRGIDFVVMIQN